MHIVIVILLIGAALSFLGAALSITSRVNLIGLGLLLFTLTLLIPAVTTA